MKTTKLLSKLGVKMPSNYAIKSKRKIIDKQKQDATLPYKQHYKAPPEMEMCSNCGRERTKGDYWRYSKCYCGGTFQSFGALGVQSTSRSSS